MTQPMNRYCRVISRLYLNIEFGPALSGPAFFRPCNFGPSLFFGPSFSVAHVNAKH